MLVFFPRQLPVYLLSFLLASGERIIQLLGPAAGASSPAVTGQYRPELGHR